MHIHFHVLYESHFFSKTLSLCGGGREHWSGRQMAAGVLMETIYKAGGLESLVGLGLSEEGFPHGSGAESNQNSIKDSCLVLGKDRPSQEQNEIEFLTNSD
jgi:hypothetical protein